MFKRKTVFPHVKCNAKINNDSDAATLFLVRIKCRIISFYYFQVNGFAEEKLKRTVY